MNTQDSNYQFRESKSATFRHELIAEEIIESFGMSRGLVGLDLGSKYPHVGRILEKADSTVIRLDLVRRDGGGVFIQADGQQMPFKDESFDFIVISHVLAHVESVECLMKEIRRILKPRGRVFILQSNRYGWWKLWGYHLKKNDRKFHLRAFDYWEIRKLISSHGMAAEKIYAPYHFYLHSKLSPVFFRLDMKLSGKVPKIFATQWLIVARKANKLVHQGMRHAPPSVIRALLFGVATLHSLFLKFLELYVRGILKKQSSSEGH